MRRCRMPLWGCVLFRCIRSPGSTAHVASRQPVMLGALFRGSTRRWLGGLAGSPIHESWRSSSVAFPRGIGCLCGDQIVCIDVDPKSGGYDSFADLERAHGRLPHTTRVLTGVKGGQRGFHLYFRVPPGTQVSSSVNTLAPGIDVKGINGFAVLPPTLHTSGVRYAVDVPLEEMSQMPAWLLALIRKPRVLREQGGSDRERSGEPISWIFRIWLRKGVPVEGGQRMNLCSLARAALECESEDPYTVDDAIDVLWTVIQRSEQTKAPWTIEEIAKLVRSIDKSPRPMLLKRARQAS
jgi:hypothetical protein